MTALRSVRQRGRGRKSAAGSLQLGFEPAPVLQEGGELLRLGPAQELPHQINPEHPAGDRFPVQMRAMPLHIHPDRPARVESEQDQIAGVAEVELRSPWTQGLAMGSGHQRHLFQRLVQPAAQQLPERSPAQQKVLAYRLEAVSVMATPLLGGQGCGQSTANQRSVVLPAIEPQHQGRVLAMDSAHG